MTRVVLDTNVIVSALLQPLGPPAQIFLLAVNGMVTLCITGDVYADGNHGERNRARARTHGE
jgi:predicted nucleic acid-binding protein